MAYVYRIRHFRKRAKLTQTELGKAIGVHQTHIGNMENGDRPLTVDYARRIAKVFGITVADLLADEDNPDRLTNEERELVALHRQASDADRATMRRVAEAIVPFQPHPSEKKFNG